MGSVVQIEDVNKYIGELILFEGVEMYLQQGEKAALVGLNGAGKTSLLDIIAGQESPDGGSILRAGGIKMAYLAQEPVLPDKKSVLDALFISSNPQVRKVRNYEEALDSGDVKAIEKAVGEMDRLKLWDFENRIKQMLTQLAITDFHQKTGDLSGGQKKRIALANVLLHEPDLLLLDEPTNHLDLNVIEWLETYLQRASLTLLMVTHDRFFLDRVCNTIYEIDQKRLYKYSGNYSTFVEQREKRIELEELEVDKAKNLLRKEEDWMSRMPKARGTKAKYRIDNYFRLKEKSSQKRNDKNMQLKVQESRLGSKILVAKDLSFSWNNDLYVNEFSYTFSRFEKVGIIGANGSGKSTFVELLTGNLTPRKGSIETGETIRFGYYTQKGLSFVEHMKVLDAVTEIAETVMLGDGNTITASQFLNYFLFPPQRQYDQISKLSGGERRRLYLCQVLMKNPNFLILDEPTNDLDIATLQVLEDYLSSFNGCVVVVSHDRYFMDSVVDHLFVFKGGAEIKDFPGNYSAYFEWKKENETDNAIIRETGKKTEKSRIREEVRKLSFKEKKELEALDLEIGKLEREKANLEIQLGSGKLSTEELTDHSIRIGKIIEDLNSKSDRWLELSELA
jgi:ATP-binding cassette subfamily F protein uup